MHYTVDYSKLSNAERKAVLDLVQYIRPKRALVLLRWLRSQQGVEFDVFAFLCGLPGVQGYPVRCAWERWKRCKLIPQ